MIRKKDILVILNRLTDKAGHVDKNAFLSAVIAMQDTKDSTFVIKEAATLRGNIIKYQRCVSMKANKGFLTEYIERLYKLSGKHDITICIGDKELKDKDITILAKDLLVILDVSKPTLVRLKNLGIIIRYDSRARIRIDEQNIEYKHKYGWLDYYDLNDIREKLNAYLGK